MKQKSLAAFFSAVFISALGLSIEAGQSDRFNMTNTFDSPSNFTQAYAKPINNTTKPFLKKGTKVFTPEKGLTGEHIYIVLLKDPALPSYTGGLPGLAATHLESLRLRRTQSASSMLSAGNRRKAKLDLNSSASIAYLKYLEGTHQQFQQALQTTLNRQPDMLFDYKYALNGLALLITQQEAMRLAKLPNVIAIERNQIQQLHTSRSPEFIGAFGVWDGSTTGLAGSMGEGMLVAIIDTGINHDHPSFAAVGPVDGFVHTNPLGDGVFAGDCANGQAELCNNKLIGSFSYDIILSETGESNGEDIDGHGTHVAGTAIGNILTPASVGDDDRLVFDQISGVAPHANVAIFQVCSDDGCPTAASNAALDDAIALGVDTINFSIGGDPTDPWSNSGMLAWKNTRAAGIFAATSAGNSGPDPETVGSPAVAPWITSVANSTHDRVFDKSLQDMQGGDTTPPGIIKGAGVTASFTAPIVFAGDFSNEVDDTPEQCLEPFPADTFNGQIVVCDRGAIARLQKGQNVLDGGAGGFVLANLDGGATSTVDDQHFLPGIHINAEDGNALKAWLASGIEHVATISETTVVFSEADGDNLAVSSSRGANAGAPDVLSPNIAAPGTAIFAAYRNEVEFSFLAGTSMASPHVAGAGALVRALHPDWTVAEVHSALASTGNRAMVKEDGETTADPFDFGGGRVQVHLAAKAGLLMDETNANFTAADPALDGDASTLNLPGLAKAQCVGQCSWTRTFTAARAGDWTASTSGAITLSVTPEAFSLTAGETQEITVSADVIALESGTWAFGQVDFTPDDADIPVTHLSVAAKPDTGNLPASISLVASRDTNSYLIEDLETLAIEDFTVRTFGLVKGDETQGMLAMDSNNGDVYDDLQDGIQVLTIEVTAGARRFVAQITASESPDLDLRVGLDENGDGIPQEEEEKCISASATALEFCELSDPEAGTYWIIVQNWLSSAPEAIDTHTIVTAVVGGQSAGNLQLETPVSVGPLEPFEIRVFWENISSANSLYFGGFDVGTNSENPGNVAFTGVNLLRGADDVSLTVDDDEVEAGGILTYTLTIAVNNSPEDIAYTVEATLPDELMLIMDSVTITGPNLVETGLIVSSNTISWSGTQETSIGKEGFYSVTDNETNTSCDTPLGGYVDLETFDIFPEPELIGDQAAFNAFSGSPIEFFGVSQSDGINLTTDGFMFFNSTSGDQPWNNLAIPTPSDPNHMIAASWRDWMVEFDDTAGSVRGISLATAGPNLFVIEYDDVEPWTENGDSPDRFDFELVMTRAVDDSPGAYEIVLAYQNIQGPTQPLTVGVENVTGTVGTQYAFDQANIVHDGLIVCFDWNRPTTVPVVITFQAQAAADAAGALVGTTLSHSVNSPGSAPASVVVLVQIASNITLSAISDSSTDEDVNAVGITVNFTDADVNDNIIQVTSDNAQVQIANLSGDTSGSTFDLVLSADYNGSATITVTVTDSINSVDATSTSFSLTINPVNDAPTANAGPDRNPRGGSTVTISSSSSDVDGDALSFSWRQTAGSNVTLTGADTASPSFAGPVVESNTDFTFELTVTDPTGLSDTDSMTVTLRPPIKTSSGSGSFGWLVLLCLPLVWIRRQLKNKKI